MTNKNKLDLENEAMELFNKGMSREAIELNLGHEFIFFVELMSPDKVDHVTLWKQLNMGLD